VIVEVGHEATAYLDSKARANRVAEVMVQFEEVMVRFEQDPYQGMPSGIPPEEAESAQASAAGWAAPGG
jgi:hypothetical protein